MFICAYIYIYRCKDKWIEQQYSKVTKNILHEYNNTIYNKDDGCFNIIEEFFLNKEENLSSKREKRKLSKVN